MSKEIEINDLHFFFQHLLQWPLLKTTQGREKLSGRTKIVFPGEKMAQKGNFSLFENPVGSIKTQNLQILIFMNFKMISLKV